MPYRVLIVDDQRDISRLLRSALETIEQGLIVSEAPSGEEAILEAGRIRFDLLIADYRLPGINGLELMKKFRIRNPQGKVIMVSGLSDSRLMQEVTQAAPDAFFAKPVPMADFLAAVETCLGLARTVVLKSETAKPAPKVEEERKGLGDTLIRLRKDLNASAVLLLNDLGEVQAEAGQLPDPALAGQLATSLLALLSAAQKVAGLIHQTENHLHLFDSPALDGILIPVGPGHAMFVMGSGLSEARLLASRWDLLSKARLDLLEALKNIVGQVEPEEVKPVQQQSALEEPYTRMEDLPSDFLDIFTQIGKKSTDADSFWDSAVEKGTTFTEPDKLTYEQASRLGLTPDSA